MTKWDHSHSLQQCDWKPHPWEPVKVKLGERERERKQKNPQNINRMLQHIEMSCHLNSPFMCFSNKKLDFIYCIMTTIMDARRWVSYHRWKVIDGWISPKIHPRQEIMFFIRHDIGIFLFFCTSANCIKTPKSAHQSTHGVYNDHLIVPKRIEKTKILPPSIRPQPINKIN